MATIDLQWGICCPEDSDFILIESSTNLLVTRTAIKSRTSWISGYIGLFTLEVLADERRKFFPLTYDGQNFVCRIAPSHLIE